MSELLIFGGTTEGRLLAEYCAENGISADVSVVTEYGASLLPDGVNILCGRLDAEQMSALMREKKYSMVIDATHPYAVEATKNIKAACTETSLTYLRLIRKSSVLSGRTAKDIPELIQLLNNTGGTILSTLGSKSLSELTKVSNYRERLWIRVLPSEKILEQCRELGYDTEKIIQEKGPFSTEQNIVHIKKSGAEILVTKESGETGGYSEKAEAARICGTEMITLMRPAEQGISFEEAVDIIERTLKI
jgi:precorrin-6x reductase